MVFPFEITQALYGKHCHQSSERPHEVLQSMRGNYSNGYKPYYPWDVGMEEKIHKNKKV